MVENHFAKLTKPTFSMDIIIIMDPCFGNILLWHFSRIYQQSKDGPIWKLKKLKRLSRTFNF
jgi:hypothetical protein